MVPLNHLLTVNSDQKNPEPFAVDRVMHRVRGRSGRGCLTEDQILAWADAHKVRTGHWPSQKSGRVADSPEETWSAVNIALRLGIRGLPGGDSLIRLLRRQRGIGERRGRRRQVVRHLLVSQLYKDGLSLAEIGRRLGVSRQAIWEMVKKN